MKKLLVAAGLLVNGVFGSCAGTVGENSFGRDNIDELKALIARFEGQQGLNSEKALHCDEDGNFCIDYSRMRVSDFKGLGSPHYSEVFEDISRLFGIIEPSQHIIMNFAGNYLTDEGVGALVDFVLANQKLKDYLKVLDLSNNRFGSSALAKLKPLVEQCPSLEKLNISINLVSDAEVKQVFRGLHSSKVYFVAY